MPELDALAPLGLVHAFSLRQGGDLGRARSAQEVHRRQERREAFARRCGVSAFPHPIVDMVHGAGVHYAEDGPLVGSGGRAELGPGAAVPVADALIARPGLTLMAFYADCQPVILFDPRLRVGALAHAGRRGALAGVAGAALRAMRTRYGSRPEQLWAGLGPCIHAECYRVGPEIVAECARHPLAQDLCPSDPDDPGGGGHFDLPALNRLDLEAAGVPASHIITDPDCTACRLDRYFSYRAEGSGSGRFATLVYVRPEAA
jgi:YfiH family protein